MTSSASLSQEKGLSTALVRRARLSRVPPLKRHFPRHRCPSTTTRTRTTTNENEIAKQQNARSDHVSEAASVHRHRQRRGVGPQRIPAFPQARTRRDDRAGERPARLVGRARLG